MASITLDRVLIHDADDLADFVSGKGRTVDLTSTRPGEVRSYAGGRRLVRRRPGRTDRIQLTMGPVSRGTLEWIDLHAGLPVLVRDGLGRVTWGVYLEYQDEPIKGRPSQATVVLTVESVSRSAAA